MSATKKLVYFHPALGFPPLYGSQVSSWEMLGQLKDCGYQIYLFVIRRSQEPISDDLEHLGIQEVFFCSPKDKKSIRHLFSIYLRLKRPDVIFMNFASWDDVLDHEEFSYATRVIYNHHFESVRDQMRQDFFSFWKDISPSQIEDVPVELSDPNIYNIKKYIADDSEFEAYNRYDYTLAISDSGLKEIQRRCKNTHVIPVKGTFKPQKREPKYQNFALLPVGTNVFNLQGYYFFIKEVLPLIVQTDPSFKVHVCGLSIRHYFEHPNVVLKGFVEDIYEEFSKARFLMCPTFGGTGQQIKILEAMGCALPSVVMFNPWQYIPIRHGIEGFITNNAEEFAQYCIQLLQDKSLAQKMGRAAKERLNQEYHSDSLKEAFKLFSSL